VFGLSKSRLTYCLGVVLLRSTKDFYNGEGSRETIRALRRIDKQAVCRDILQSRLYGSQQSDDDEYADLFDAEVTRVLKIHAPLRTGRRRCSSQHDTYVLSDEAVEAKRHRRRAERRYRRTGLPSDKRAFKATCNAARTSIMTSRADHIRTQQQQASGDIRATWRTAQSLLHSRQKVIYDDSEYADLVGKFSSFFVDKVRRIRITSRRRYSGPPPGCSLHNRIPDPSYRISSR